jgi:IS605 OrfB family transposase
MKLTLKIKLIPAEDQYQALIETINEANNACNLISKIAWGNKTFNQFKLHHLCYNNVREKFNLSSQMVIRCISKVVDAYKLDKKKQRIFRDYGSISYDSRILSYSDDFVSIWTVSKRKKIAFVCHNPNYFPYIKGEADLVFKKDKFYIFQTIELPEQDMDNVEEFIGCDFGITDIVCTSEGKTYSSQSLNQYRKKRRKIRSSIQSKGTRSSRRLLKRLNKRERTTAMIINHTISNQIITDAKTKGVGVAIEDLSNIRSTSKRRNKSFRTELNSWSFYQLRTFLEYKAKRVGVPLIAVQPAYTSQTCCNCHHIGTRNNKSFKCGYCGNNMDADINAAKNIALIGAVVNQPEKSSMWSCSLHITA